MAGTSISFDIIARDMASAKLGRVGAAAERSSGPIGRLGKSMGSMAKTYGPLAAAAAGAFAVKLGVDAVNAASDFSESMSKVGVVFKDSADAVVDWSEDAAQAMGLSQQAALEASSTLGNLMLSMDKTPEQAAKMSKSMVQLAADLASFNNVEINEVLMAMRSGLTGEIAPLRRFGVNLTDATLKAKALELGLYDGVGALDVSAKSTAAYQLIMEQTTTAQGDFARTSSGLANQQRILAAQFEDVKAELGEKLLPVAVEFTTWLNSDGIPLARQFGDEMKDLRFVADAFSDAMRDAGPLLDLFSSNAEDASDASKLLSAAFATIKGPLAATSFALRWMGKSLGLVGEAGRALWNNALAPAFRAISSGVAHLADGFAAMFRAMSKAPGFGWAKDAANAMEGAADKARALAAGIRDIPSNKTITITTFYKSIGAPRPEKGGPGQGQGVLLPRGGGSAGRSVTGRSPRGLGASPRMSSGVTAEDIRAALEGMAITIVDGDAGRRAIMAVPGAI